jgi:hypothetical protein
MNHFAVYNLNIKFPTEEWKLMYTTELEVESFLDEYKRSRVIVETTVRASLNRALEFEQKFQRPFYQFTTDEILEMYKSTHAISDRSLQNTNLILKHASRWMIDKKKLNIKSTYEDMTKELIRECVDTQRKASLILTKDELEEIQSELLNWTDKAILFLLFEGVGGHMLKELMFMDWDQVSRTDLKIYFRSGKTIDITAEQYELLRYAFQEEELISFGTTSRVSRVKSSGIYKIRFNSLSDNDDITNPEDVERRYRFCQRRLMLISKDLGVAITSGSIQESGFLHYIKEGMQSSGLDFLQYIKTEECKALARRYDLYTDLYVQVVKDKFFKYFQ